ncbi:family 3 glycoside hydrolase [Cryphonectria parasitica EP155]|uniref:beta-glucosidase n=1 Tax=Cryphonectria parasitica (strain ATCC 38755 / EP155) TaxID=660469 RepID=A0A9P5CKQ4_CRYP1|nr:family 3 glycoside hydrolase [Cryphonectria parasitica EP155]KAF3761211.1 family 3 glycoside hydrolase [Cryphonectria parasitica EP155]
MADINVEEVLKKLSDGEKCDLLSGIDFWHTKGLPQHGIPSLRLSDGPNGVRGTKFFNGTKAACFPCGTGLGATFNLPLLHEAGIKMGDEAKSKGAHVILGPTINMQRSPLGGRGFESLGEDPVLAGLGAAALVRGIQSTGVQATIKHFVCNDQEHKRNGTNAIVTERALREIYARPFQIVVRDGHPGSFMTAYNGVNGEWCSQNEKLLGDLLRREWGWKGLVMSDWFGTYSTVEAVKAGLDLEMPGPPRFRGEPLKFSVETEKVREHELDERARTMLEFVKTCAASGVKEGQEERAEDTPETAALLRKIGSESIVLLKNEGGLLPLKKDKKTVVIGPNAKIATYHGGGSASLAAFYAVTPFDGISAKLSTTPGYTIGQYSHKMLPLLGLSVRSLSGRPGMTMTAYNEHPLEKPDRRPVDEVEIDKTELLLVDYYNPKITSPKWYADFEGSFVADEDCTWELSLVVVGTAKLFCNGELIVDNDTQQTAGDTFFNQGTVEEKGRLNVRKGQTYSFKVQFGSAATSKLRGGQVLFGSGALRIGGCKVIDPAAEIRRAADLARDADQVIICAGLNADWETEGSDRAGMDLPPGIDELIEAVAEATSGKLVVVNQSGTPVTMPWASKVNAVVQAWYGGNETGNAIADVLFGDFNPSGKLSLSWPEKVQDNPAFLNFRTEGGRTIYGEDIYIGYRYYEFAQRAVLFPFGHGLSYTTFAFSGLQVATSEKGKLSVSVQVKNTGETKGAEVVQVYVAPKQKAKVNRPPKEMQGFAKIEVGPGETKEAKVEMETKYAASYFDEERNKWCVEEGEYEVIVSNSSEVKEGKAVRGTFKVPKTFWWSGI